MGKHNRTNYNSFYKESQIEQVEQESTNLIVEIEEPEVVEEVVEEKKTAVVLAKRLYVRSEPYIGAKDIDIVEQGDKLTVLEILDGWIKVSIPSGDEGYVMDVYVEIV